MIDASVKLFDGQEVTGPAGCTALLRYSPQFVRMFPKMMTYALGRGVGRGYAGAARRGATYEGRQPVSAIVLGVVSLSFDAREGRNLM